jgi:hypothetical protein
MLAHKLSCIALAAAALPALASAQSAALSATSAATLGDLSTVAPLLEPMPFGPHSAFERGVLVGGWIDPSYAAVGSMAAGLYDEDGELEFDLSALLFEYIASAAGQRFGGIQGQLYQQGVATAIQVGGTWTIDTATNRGTFELDLYLGGVSPTAPLLAVGSVKGRLGAPQGPGASGGGQVLASTKPSGPAGGAASGELSVEQAGALSEHGGALSTGAGATGGICLAGGVEALPGQRRALEPSAYPGGPSGGPTGGGSHGGPQGGPVCTGGPGMSAAGATSSGAFEASATSGSTGTGSSSSGAAAGSVGAQQLVIRDATGRWGLL